MDSPSSMPRSALRRGKFPKYAFFIFLSLINLTKAPVSVNALRELRI